MNNAETSKDIEIKELKLRLVSIEYLLKTYQVSTSPKLVEYARELSTLY